MTGRTMFVYWGRRGLTALVADLARALVRRPEFDARLSISRQNELADAFAALGAQVELFDTFARGYGAAAALPGFLARLRALVARLKRDGVTAVVVLMPHVWTPILGHALRRAGIGYAVVVHDAGRHPGDATGLVQRWIHVDLDRADLVFALSRSVGEALVAAGRVRRERLRVLFLPLIGYDGGAGATRPREPLRLLFFGRIMAYKGLPLLVEALEILRREGIAPQLGVYGEGSLAGLAGRLEALGAEISNAWIDHDAVGGVLARFDAGVMPYVEASQSGPVSAAFAAGMPVVATPVGGLVEQVEDGVTGLIAREANAPALADCIRRLCVEPGLYPRLAANVERLRHERSVERFIEQVVGAMAEPRR